jgi:RHS repeat-associated protein
MTSNFVDSQHPATLGTFTYLPSGAVNKVIYGNGLTSTAMFNKRLQFCRQDMNSSGTMLGACGDPTPSGSLLDYTYTWPAGTNNGTLQGWTATGQQVFNRSFGYDSLNRLTSMSDSDTAASCRGLTWTYDAWGNRLTQTPTAGSCGSWSVSYNADNQMSGYTYDAAGNLENDGSHGYSYDAENNIVSVDGGSTATYVYDANGARVSKTAGGVETDYVIDAAGHSLSAYGGGCGTSCWDREYISAAGQSLAEYGTSTTYFTQTDNVGSMRLMTAMNQSVYDSMDFTPFGEQILGGSGSIDKFTGYQQDSESNLDYASARFYGSPQGRFLSPDPGNAGADLTNPQSWNMYAYVLNNPMTNIDPTGRNCFDSGIFYQVTTSMGTGTNEATCDFSDMLNVGWDYFLAMMDEMNVQAQAQVPPVDITMPSGGSASAPPSSGCAVLTASCSVTVTATVGCPMTELLCQAEYATLQPALQDNSGCRFFLQNPCGSPPQTQQKSQAPKTPSPAPNNTPKPSFKDQFKKAALNYLCGTSVENEITQSMVDGAVTGGVTGALEGGIGGGILTAGPGGVPGAILGGWVGGVFGAAGGIFHGAEMAAVCSVFHVY